jgi:hypothetical protein
MRDNPMKTAGTKSRQVLSVRHQFVTFPLPIVPSATQATFKVEAT